MTGSLFVTGASGFVGRHFVARARRPLSALSRTEQPASDGVTWVRGDLKTAPYGSVLRPDTVVVHLAAATGNAAATQHRAVNAEGTELLLKACERARVAGFIFVSSIAARYPEDSHYPYATAKREAELVVRSSSVPFVIVRPTIVLGFGSPILDKLRALASGPVIAAIGSGAARVQPVDVTDVAAALAALVERRSFDGATLEFGGPEVLTMAELLHRVRAALGKPPARVIGVPYGPMRGGLIALEAVLGKRSPVTAGQLSAFVNDSVAQPNALWESMRPSLVSLDRMVATDAGR